MFYTRIPCPKYVDHSEEYLNKATRYFPLVGIIVGVISFIFYWISNQIFNVQISVIISIASGILVQGHFTKMVLQTLLMDLVEVGLKKKFLKS